MTKILLLLLSMILVSCNVTKKTPQEVQIIKEEMKEVSLNNPIHFPQEKNLANVKQLTFGGDNAEAYFSYDDQSLSLQISNKDKGLPCDQIFFMDTEGKQKPKMISTGKGRTTCSFYLPGDTLILYASTHLGGDECPKASHLSGGKYVWPIFDTYDIFVANKNGDIVKQLTDEPGYDAEATISPDGKTIVFTSTRSGDLELWTMDIEGNNLHQVTSGLGYDGGAFFSADSKQLIFRASRPKTEKEIKNYKELLAKNLVQPTAMELFICDVGGSNLRQITNLGKANWAPYLHPNGKTVLFASNYHSKTGRKFNIFQIGVDGKNLKQITFGKVFDSFPMFSRDGKKLVFSSNRNNGGGRDTNVFIADWID